MNLSNGIKNNLPYFRWKAKLNNTVVNLNLSRTNKFEHKFIIYCQHCHKKIKEYTISQLFTLKYANLETV